MRVDPSAPICAAFLRGFCDGGLACTKRHTLVCPATAAGGTCPNRATCRLHHPARRERKRAREAEAAPPGAARASTPPPEAGEPLPPPGDDMGIVFGTPAGEGEEEALMLSGDFVPLGFGSGPDSEAPSHEPGRKRRRRRIQDEG